MFTVKNAELGRQNLFMCAIGQLIVSSVKSVFGVQGTNGTSWVRAQRISVFTYGGKVENKDEFWSVILSNPESQFSV